MANFNEKINSHKEFVMRDSEHDYFIKRIGSMTLLKLEFGYNVNYLKSGYRLFIQYKDACRVKKLAGRCFVWACTPNTRGISDIQRFCLDLDVDEDTDNVGNPIFDYIAGAVLISEKGVITYGDTWFETFDLEKNYVTCCAYICGRMVSGFRIPSEAFDIFFGLKENFPKQCEKPVQEENDLIEEVNGKDIVLKEFLGDLYDYLMVLTNNDKQRVLKILERYADKSGFFERIKEHIEYLEIKLK